MHKRQKLNVDNYSQKKTMQSIQMFKYDEGKGGAIHIKFQIHQLCLLPQRGRSLLINTPCW